MKKRNKIKLIAVLLMAFAMSLTACAGGGIYDKLADTGYTVRVRFDAGGAVVNETPNTTIVEVYGESDTVTRDGKTGIALLAPDNTLRGADATFKLAMTDGESNFFQAGWYTSRNPRTDSAGNPVDAYGVPTAESGREQAYVYSGKWDFSKDLIDPAEYAGEELTLYAAWIPFYKYEFYLQDGEGFTLLSSMSRIDVRTPEWDADDGEYKMNDFPDLPDGKIFEGAYFDEAMTQSVPERIDGDNTFVDFEKGIQTSYVIRIYIAAEDAE
ncbi:MAG: hypothetical protein IJX80_05585 [Clostridia bacterium]|nr:hypothetical protein [Clostridia bacterium]